MKNKYFILVFTFLCLLAGQSTYSQDWQDMGFDDATNALIQDYEDNGGTVDVYDNAQDYADAVNNDDDLNNDYNSGDDNNYNDSNDSNDSNNDNTGVAYWTDTSGINMYSDGEGRTYADMNNDGIFQPTEVVDDSLNSGSSDNSSNDDDSTDIYDGLLDTHNYDNDTGGSDDDQYPYPDDTNNNDDTPSNDTPTPDAPPTRRPWYLDNDGDGYYISYVVVINKPDGNYTATTRGVDCDDNNYSKNLGTDCGWKKWYLDEDKDEYHSDETEQADFPGIGWVLTTRGVDCEESDPEITDQCRRQTWYFDWDGDEYHSSERVAGDSPGAGWVLTTKGVDCNDEDPTITIQCRPSTCKGCTELLDDLNGYENIIASANIVDPYTGLYPTSTNSSISFLDGNGNEPVPSIYALNPNFTLKSWQWYSTLGVYDSETFDKAALYCTTNLKTNAFQAIGQRQAYYQWADGKVAKYSRWFGAAEIVTKWNAVGSAERLNMWYLNDAADKFLKEGNKFLFQFNMANAKAIIAKGALTGTFKDTNGKTITFNGLKNKQLDYAMVLLEQTKIEGFIKQYRLSQTPETMTSIMNSINFSMSSLLAPNEVVKVIKENFSPSKGQPPFNFSDYNHRVILGQKLIDQLYK